MHAGVNGLSLLAVPLYVDLLEALRPGDFPLSQLSKAVGHPPASTLRSYLRNLEDLGAIERHREPQFPAAVSYCITAAGTELLEVEKTLEGWLALAPDGSVPVGSQAAKSVVKALVDGWSSGIVRAFAARPFALTELSRLIPSISYPTLERRLSAMRRVGLVEARRNGSGRGTPYRATAWLRRAVAPLTASIEWEQKHCEQQAAPLRRMDIEATLLLAVPMLELEAGTSTVCRVAVELSNGATPDYAGVVVTVQDGRPVSWQSRLDGRADAWASGSVTDWLRCFNGGDQERLEFGGDPPVAMALADSLRKQIAAGEPLRE
jgi:DNA-binding HxlR family transcriptional regulator